AIDRLPREAVRARHLPPHEEAEPVGPVEVARILDLLVLADPVEAHALRELDVAAEGGVVGRRHSGLGPVSLVEHEAEQEGPAVQEEPVAAHGDLTERRVALDDVEHFAVLGRESELGEDQRRRRRAPEEPVAIVVYPRVRERDRAVDLARYDAVGVVRQHHGADAEPDAEPQSLRALTRDPDVELDLPT